jgi:aspartyl/asparaginyl beta-hydroxylase (cupin superfamily)
VHFRGKARLPFYKQLLDHSTLLFPCSAMVKSDETFRRNMRM